MRVLVIAAHPDDEVLMCGGALHRFRQEWDTKVLVLAENSSRHGNSDVCSENARNAQRLLKYGSLNMLMLPDQKLDQHPFGELVGYVEALVDRHNPQLVITHCREDLNRDHRITNEAVHVAVRSHRSQCDIWEAQVPGSNSCGAFGLFKSNTVVRLDQNDVDAKWKAMLQYAEEVVCSPHARSTEKLIANMEMIGSQAMTDFAEEFNCVRRIL